MIILITNSQIQRLKNDKSLQVEDVIKPLPDYTSTCQRIRLFICGIILLIVTIIFATLSLFSIFSKIIEFGITNNTNYHDDLIYFINFLKEDWHYSLLIPILFPWSVILGWLGWLGFKLYRHN